MDACMAVSVVFAKVEGLQEKNRDKQMKQVQILLSTYNGAEWLPFQMDSLAEQTYPEISILVRDDGSCDQTISLLNKYEKRLPQMTWYAGKNIGIWKSFWDLLEHADAAADYFAFCDQDDVWFPDKLEHGILQLEQQLKELPEELQEELPALYCGSLLLTDKNLHPLHTTISFTGFRPSFGNAVLQNIATGCTCIFNRALLTLVRSNRPDYMVMHDWWLYLTASCFGTVIYDNTPKLYYRQHGTNSIGARTGRLGQWKYRLFHFWNNRGNLYHQNQEFLRLFSLPKEKEALLCSFLETQTSWKSRLKFLKNKKLYRQDRWDDWIYRIVVLAGMA